MVTILSPVVSSFAFRFRSRASLEVKLIAISISWLSCADSGPVGLSSLSLDRLLLVWLYRIWPQVIMAGDSSARGSGTGSQTPA